MEGWSVLSSGRRRHSLLQTQPNPPLLPLPPSDSPDLSPVDPDSPSAMTDSPCHTPQLDPCLQRMCVCVCVRGGEERRGSVCGLCHGVCHLLSHNTLGIVCVFVCVCGQRGLVPGGPILRGCGAITCQAEDMSPRGG